MPSRRLVKDPERYKTVLCATWTTSGACPYGRKCQFAHGKEELRVRAAPPLNVATPQQNQPPMPMPAQSLGGAMRPSLSHPMPLWPSASHPQHPGSQGLPLPPLPPMPPGAHSGMTNLDRGLLLNPPMGAPPLPRGPPPSSCMHPPAMSSGGAFVQQPPLPSALLPGAALPGATMPSFQQMPPPPPPPPPLAQPPSAEPPMASAPLAPAAAPAALPPTPVAAAPVAAAPAPLSVSDELACFAMQCHLSTDITTSSGGEPGLVRARESFRPGELSFGASGALWSPLRVHADSSRSVESTPKGEVGGLSPKSPSSSVEQGLLSPSEMPIMEQRGADSPVEPGFGKREVSFQTQMVRRAVSFIFESSLEDPAVGEPRRTTMSPHTAIAA